MEMGLRGTSTVGRRGNGGQEGARWRAIGVPAQTSGKSPIPGFGSGSGSDRPDAAQDFHGPVLELRGVARGGERGDAEARGSC